MDKFLEFFRGLTRVHIASIAGAVVLLVMGIFILVLVRPNLGRDNPESRAIYFFNPSEGRLDAEFHLVPYPTPPMGVLSMVDMAIVHMMEGPRRSGLSKVWPSDMGYHDLIMGLEMYGNTLVANFFDTYNEMSPLDEALFRSAFTLTMVGLPHIHEVQMRVVTPTDAGNTWAERTESFETIANSPSIAPVRITNAYFSLYFVDETGEGLVVERYFAEDVNSRRLGRDALARLIEGPSDPDFTPAFGIPEGTRVRDVTIGEGFAADIYVNLSSDFLTGFGGTTTQANLMIGSIVNTLVDSVTPLLRQRSVFFMIDSVRREDFHGVEDFHLAFHFDETIMLGFEVEIEEDEEYWNE